MYDLLPFFINVLLYSGHIWLATVSLPILHSPY